MISQSLQDLGLSKKEADMYLLLLEMNGQPASNMAIRLQIARSSAQYILNLLVKKELARKHHKNGMSHYFAVKPSHLFNFLERQSEVFMSELDEKKNKLSQICPLLENRAKKNLYLPKVSLYDGVENVIDSFSEFLDGIPEGATIYNCVFPAPVEFKRFRKGMQKFIHKRLNKKIFCKTICAYCPDAIRLKLTDDSFMRETMITLKSDSPQLFSEILLYNDRVLDVAYSAQYAMISSLTMSRDIASTRMKLFDLSWVKASHQSQELLKSKEVQQWMSEFEGITEY